MITTRQTIAVGLLALSGVLIATGVAHAKGKTPFEIRATMTCDGRIDWTVTLGVEPGQAFQVVVDSPLGGPRIGGQPAPNGGTFTGSYNADPRIPHLVLFRRVVEGKVEEAVSREVRPCTGGNGA